MHDPSTMEVSQLKVPAELLAASHRVARPKSEQLRVDAFRVSWLTRLGELFVGKD
jgi:hypothetical protein